LLGASEVEVRPPGGGIDEPLFEIVDDGGGIKGCTIISGDWGY